MILNGKIVGGLLIPAIAATQMIEHFVGYQREAACWVFDKMV